MSPSLARTILVPALTPCYPCSRAAATRLEVPDSSSLLNSRVKCPTTRTRWTRSALRRSDPRLIGRTEGRRSTCWTCRGCRWCSFECSAFGYALRTERKETGRDVLAESDSFSLFILCLLVARHVFRRRRNCSTPLPADFRRSARPVRVNEKGCKVASTDKERVGKKGMNASARRVQCGNQTGANEK